MLEFQLFRLKVFLSGQTFLFQPQRTRAETLRTTILTLPSARLRKENVWHIGNVVKLDDQGMYFRIGRTSRLTFGSYHDGNFGDEEFETAPYTHAVLDVELGVCALARKPQLAPKTQGIAHQLGRLLNHAVRGAEAFVMFEIAEIADPEDFVTHLRQALAISRFWVTVSRPNPFDENEDFIKPFQKLLAESDANKARAQVDGVNLKTEVIEELARSAASVGNDAGATLIEPEGRRVRKRLRGNSVSVTQEDVGDEQSLQDLIHLIRQTYRNIRMKSEPEE
jgi:hypothetical protein